MNVSASISKTTSNHGFTLIELMVVMAVIAILATLAMPSGLNQRLRLQVVDAAHMADTIRQDVTNYYNRYHKFPSNNHKAGLPAPELLIGNKVTRIEIENGAIHITLGNKVYKSLQDKILTLRPAVVTGSPASPISWLCGFDTPVPGMTAVGINKTDLEEAIVPSSCTK